MRYSRMVNVSSATLAGDYFFHQGAEAMGNSFYNRLFVKRDADNKLAFGIQKFSGTGTGQTYTGFEYELGKTYLIVVKYEFKSDVGDDEVSIVVNPVGPTEPTTWSAVNVIGKVSGDAKAFKKVADGAKVRIEKA